MVERFPRITAHTGCMGTLDNTLASIEKGLLLGADIVEDDIRVTRDGIAVLAHDDLWQTVEGHALQLSKINFEALREQEVVADHGGSTGTMTFTTLEEMLLRVKASGKMANLDLKVDEAIDAVAELVRKHDMLDLVFLSGCEVERAQLAQQRQPQLQKLLNAKSEHFMTLVYDEAVEQTLSDALSASCFGVNLYHAFAKPELIARAQALGLKVYVWTVNETHLMEHYTVLGVDSITTRSVEALVHLKQQRQQ
jgi:glycerophosphoryl diester phosphodiesterase